MVRARPDVNWGKLLGERLPALSARLTARRLILLAAEGPNARGPSDDQLNAHNHPELCVVLKGVLDILTQGPPIRLRAGSVLVVAPHMYHRSVAVGGAAQAVWLRATPTHMGGSIASVDTDGRIDSVSGLDLIDFARGYQVLSELADELASGGRGWLEAARALLAMLFVRAWRRLGADGRVLPPLEEWSAAQIVSFNARDYIQRNYAHPLSLAEVAHHVALSPNYLASLFKREFGRTIIDFLTEVRIEAAKRLLRETDRKMADIASEVGYHSPYYFSRAFKKVVGCSPRQFRLSAPP